MIPTLFLVVLCNVAGAGLAVAVNRLIERFPAQRPGAVGWAECGARRLHLRYDLADGVIMRRRRRKGFAYTRTECRAGAHAFGALPPEHQVCPACRFSFKDIPAAARELEYYHDLVVAILRRRGRSLAAPEIIWNKAVFTIAVGAEDGRAKKVPVEGYVDQQGLWGVLEHPPETLDDEIDFVVTHLPTGRALTSCTAGKRPSERTIARAFFAARAFCVAIGDLTDWRRSDIEPDPALGQRLHEIAEWLTGGAPVLH